LRANTLAMAHWVGADRGIVSATGRTPTGACMKRIDDLPVKSKVAVSVTAQVASQAVSAVIAVVLLKVITGKLGAPNYGIYATVLAFVTTFSLFADLGLNAITGREIARRPEAASQIISDNMAFRIALCCVAMPVIAGGGLLVYPHRSRELHICIALFALDLLFDAVRAVALSYYNARARNDVVAAVMTTNQIAFLGFAVISIHLGYGVGGVVCAYLAADLLGASISVMLVRRKIPIRLRIRPGAWRLVARISLPLGIIQVVNMLYLKADSVVISIIKGPIQVGYYGAAYSVIGAAIRIPSMIMSPLMPSMATARDLRPIVQRAIDLMVMLALPMAVGGFLLRRQIILAISTKQFLPAAAPFGILIVASAFTYVSTIFGFASVAADTHRRLVRISIASLVLNVILNLLVVPHWGIKGAAWATAFTEAITSVMMFRTFSVATHTQLRIVAPTWRPAIASLLLIPVYSLLRHHWAASNRVVVAIVVLGLIYFALLAAMGNIPPEISGWWSRAKERRSRRKARHRRAPTRRRPTPNESVPAPTVVARAVGHRRK
jgi:O-antigen/teichoic acid export membrane protein